MGEYDLYLMLCFGVVHRVKGVMYRPQEPDASGSYSYEVGHQYDGSIVLQDALGDYYFFHQDHVGTNDFVGRFRTPRGTSAEEFVQKYFRGACVGVDMDEVPFQDLYDHYDLDRRQAELAKLRDEAEDRSECACAARCRGVVNRVVC